MQRKLSSFDIYVIVSELQDLKGSYIDKIYQLTRNELLIRVKNINTKQKENIFIRNGEFICTTEKQFETPTKPSTFAMTLRKYLLNGRVTEVIQHEFLSLLKRANPRLSWNQLTYDVIAYLLIAVILIP